MKEERKSGGVVEETNDSSTTSKASMVRVGYFQDDFIVGFVPKSPRRSPIINRGYFIRTWTVDMLARAFILKRTAAAGLRVQFISIGAGFDTLFFRLAKDRLLERCTFVELDFFSVVQRKIEMLTQRKVFTELLGNVPVECIQETGHWSSDAFDYHLLCCDLRDLASLNRVFLGRCRLDPSAPTFVLSECVLTYLHSHQSDAVLDWFGENFSQATIVLYEQLRPEDGFGLFMREHFAKIGSPLQTIRSYPTLASLQNRLSSRPTWSNGEAVSMNYVFNFVLPHSEKERIRQLEPFDEFEIWHQKCAHYALIFGSQSEDSFQDVCQLLKVPGPGLPSELAPFAPIGVAEWRRVDDLRRFGHRICLISLEGKDLILVSGGFGVARDRRHCKLANLAVFCLSTKTTIPLVVETEDESGAEDWELHRMYHEMLALEDGTVALFGGRASPLRPSPSFLLLRPRPDAGGVRIGIRSIRLSGDVPEPRWRFGASRTNDGDIFLCGGLSVAGRTLSDTYRISVQEWSCRRLEDLPIALHSHACARQPCTGLVYCSGGLTELETVSTDVFQFDSMENRWRKLSFEEPIARYGHNGHFLDKDKMVLVGGTNAADSPGNSLVTVRLENGAVSIFEGPEQADGVPVLCLNHDSALWRSELVIVGGGGNCFSFGTLFNPGICFRKIQ